MFILRQRNGSHYYPYLRESQLVSSFTHLSSLVMSSSHVGNALDHAQAAGVFSEAVPSIGSFVMMEVRTVSPILHYMAALI